MCIPKISASFGNYFVDYLDLENKHLNFLISIF